LVKKFVAAHKHQECICLENQLLMLTAEQGFLEFRDCAQATNLLELRILQLHNHKAEKSLPNGSRQPDDLALKLSL